MNKRKTGRTSRAILAAADKASNYGYCFFLCLGSQIDNIVNQMKYILGDRIETITTPNPSVKVYLRDGGQIAIEAIGSCNFDYQYGKVRGSHPKCELVVDHYALEVYFAWVLEEAHRYDIKE